MISFGLPRITYPHCRECFFQRRPTDTVEGAASPKMRKRRAAQWAVAVLLEPPTQALLTEVVPARPHLHRLIAVAPSAQAHRAFSSPVLEVLCPGLLQPERLPAAAAAAEKRPHRRLRRRRRVLQEQRQLRRGCDVRRRAVVRVAYGRACSLREQKSYDVRVAAPGGNVEHCSGGVLHGRLVVVEPARVPVHERAEPPSAPIESSRGGITQELLQDFEPARVQRME